MSFIDKILESMRLSPDDDEDDNDYYGYDDYDDDGYEEEKRPSKRKKPKKNDDDDLYDKDEPAAPKSRFITRPGKVVPLRSTGRNMEVCSIKPTSMEDSREICDTLLSGRAVILNLEGLHMEIAQRIIDFTSGACYAMNGNLQKVSNFILVVTPENVELSGDFQTMLAESGSDLDLSIHL